MNYRNIVRFLIAVEEVQTPEMLLSELERLLTSYKFENYCLFQQSKMVRNPANLIMATNWSKEWLSRYVEKKYFLIDPAIRYLMRSHHGFKWSQAIKAFQGTPQYKRMRLMMRDAAEHGLQEGYIFPIHGRFGLMGGLTVSGPNVELSPAEMALFGVAADRAYWRMMELVTPDAIPVLSNSDAVVFSRRETEALHLLAEGMTSTEISAKLNISSHTANWYMTKIQKKLKARNRHHVTAIAIRLGIIG